METVNKIGLTAEELRLIDEKTVAEYPDPENRSCSSKWMTVRIKRKLMKEKLISEAIRKKLYNDDLAA